MEACDEIGGWMDKKFRCVLAWDGLAYLAGVVLSLFYSSSEIFDCWHCDLGVGMGWMGLPGYWGRFGRYLL